MMEPHAIIDKLDDGTLETLLFRVTGMWPAKDTADIAKALDIKESTAAAVLAFSRDCMFEEAQETK